MIIKLCIKNKEMNEIKQFVLLFIKTILDKKKNYLI